VKKFTVFLFISVLLTGTVFAQNRDNRPNKNDRKQEVTKVSIEGLLKLEKGFVAVESGGSVYFVPKLNRYIGFITGLREGGKVSVEGYEFNNMIHPTKATIDGKSYDFIAWNRERGPGQGFEKRDFRSDNNRRTPAPRWNNQGYGRYGGYGGCCW